MRTSRFLLRVFTRDVRAVRVLLLVAAGDIFRRECSRRGSRYPAGAHTVTVALRVDCAAVLGLGSHRGTRYVRFALYARTTAVEMFTKCAARTDPSPVLLAATENRPRRVPTPATWSVGFLAEEDKQPPFRKGVLGWAAARLLRRRGAELSRLRAQRASSTLSSRLSERRERSEQSEFRDAAVKASTAGQSTRSATAAVKRRGLPGRTFAASTNASNASLSAPSRSSSEGSGLPHYRDHQTRRQATRAN